MFQAIRLLWVDGNRSANVCARKAKEILLEKGIRVLTAEDSPADCSPELVITFGGDGTLLS